MSQRPLVFIIIPIPTGLSRGASAGKRIAAPICTPRALASRRGLARNDKVRRDGVLQWSAAEQMPLGYDVPHKTCRGERPCPPRMTAAPCRAGPACPAGSNAYFAAGHMGPALRDLRLTHPAAVRKADTNCEQMSARGAFVHQRISISFQQIHGCALCKLQKMRLIIYKSRVPALFSHRAPELKRRIKFSKLSYLTLICN